MVSSLNGKAHIMFYYIIEDKGSSPFSPAYLSIDSVSLTNVKACQVFLFLRMNTFGKHML